ncbi:MAG: glycosyltransferase [bacterium]|jgi:glycosyltransferase involved in cell wall biosynthesis
MRSSIGQESSFNNPRQEVRDFLAAAAQQPAPFFFLQFSGVKYVEMEGQRPLRLANEAQKLGLPVLYVYLDRPSRLEAVRVSPHLLVISSGLLSSLSHEIFAAPLPGVKILCIHFPHPLSHNYLPPARENGWVTVYDCMDSWREFHPLGQAYWFSEAVEAEVCRKADIIIATNSTLGQELLRFGAIRYTVIPNGVDPGRLDRNLPPLLLPRGEITVGFFGYITRAWFDWNRLVQLAKRHQRWLFPVIWWGEDWPPGLPPNIHSLGSIPHTELPRYTRYWDVGFVNFKNSRLIHCSCPIKIYEYLHLGLPVVSVPIPHLREYPYVYTAVSLAEFERQIIRAAQIRPQNQIVDPFIKQHTWQRLFGLFLDRVRQHVAERSNRT